jgi:hypothetical protein
LWLISYRERIPRTLPFLSEAREYCWEKLDAGRGVEGSREYFLCHAATGRSHDTFVIQYLRPERSNEIGFLPCGLPFLLFDF